jgi:hypothetical protein
MNNPDAEVELSRYRQVLAIIGGGAIGGMLPTIARLAATYVAQPLTPLPEIGLYFGLALYAGIGSAVAFVMAPFDRRQIVLVELRQALIAGIAAPAILGNIIAGAAETRPKMATAIMIEDILSTMSPVGSARAQEEDEIDSLTTKKASVFLSEEQRRRIRAVLQGGSFDMKPEDLREVTIRPIVVGETPTVGEIIVSVEFGSGDEKKIVRIGSITDFRRTRHFIVPKTTTRLFIGDKPVSASELGLGEMSDKRLEIGLIVDTKPTRDFLWALGAPRKYGISGVEISMTPTDSPTD